MSIGAIVVLLFGCVTFLLVRSAMMRVHYSMLHDESRSIATSLATSCARPLLTGEILTIKQRIDDAVRTTPAIRYVIVRDTEGDVLAHTFERNVPEDLSRPLVMPSAEKAEVVVFDSPEGAVFACSAPILGGRAGTLDLGISDLDLRQETASLSELLAWGLILCASVGTLLALMLAWLLTGPIRQLVEASRRVEMGDFDARARIHSSDEIGRLSLAFNRMGESLLGYRAQVEEKERARLAIIERIVDLQEEERRAISRELHDQIGQSLSALLLDVQSNGGAAAPEGKRRVETERAIVQLIENVRRLAWDMRPPVLDDHGLDSALSRYAKDMSRKAGVDIHYEYCRQIGMGRAPGRVEVTLYRVAQEAITNVVRHSGADRASIVVLHRTGEIVLIVEDNGRGFDVDAVLRDPSRALGLTGTRERMGLLGGRFSIESTPGQGTTVRVSIPLAGTEPCPSAS
ncbi:MAG: HAMP domain-containing protein [Planctomycetes bacterium]|nr:HAMP domain-containing protein [Planctomycetota bacterium]